MTANQCSCKEVNESSDGHDNRVDLISDVGPECACEQFSLSEHSPGPVTDGETIIRMVCVPMHVHRKKPELTPSFFSHVFSKGMSAQRLEKATDAELAEWVNKFLSANDERVWLGYVSASCEALRGSRIEADDQRLFCVYDAALPDNVSHIEVASARRLPEADVLEARAKLRRAFSEGAVFSRASLRKGSVAALVSQELIARRWPVQWQSVLEPQAKAIEAR